MSRIGSLLALVLLTACGLGGNGAGGGLDGREFLSTRVTMDGAERPLVAGTQVRLTFRDGEIGASAGCNSIGGSYEIQDGTLVMGAASMTEMGCDPDRMAQDEWLVTFLSSRPAIVLIDRTLTLTSDDTVIALLDREVADPDLPLVGPTWTVDGIIQGDTVASIAGAAGTLTFGANGQVEIDTGCNTGSASYEATDEGLRFVDVVLTDHACRGNDGMLEAALLPILAADRVGFTIDAQRLSLAAGDHGLDLIGS